MHVKITVHVFLLLGESEKLAHVVGGYSRYEWVDVHIQVCEEVTSYTHK